MKKKIQIIAQQGDGRYLIDLGYEDQGQIFDINEEKLYPPINIHSILARGYWEEYKGDTERDKLIVKLFNKLNGSIIETLTKTFTCPDCGGKLMDDYWDEVEEDHRGNFNLDAFEAWVCENRCGYYIRLIRP